MRELCRVFDDISVLLESNLFVRFNQILFQQRADGGFVVGLACVIEAKKTGVNPSDVALGAAAPLPKSYEGIDPSKVNLDYLIDTGMCICGSPDSCIKQVERLQLEAKLDQLLCMMQFWAIPHEKTMRAIDLWGKNVIPHFAKRSCAAEEAVQVSPGAR
jgi:hypothetical protein